MAVCIPHICNYIGFCIFIAREFEFKNIYDESIFVSLKEASIITKLVELILSNEKTLEMIRNSRLYNKTENEISTVFIECVLKNLISKFPIRQCLL